MEKKELDLITELSETDPQVKTLWEDHLQYKKQLDELEKRPYRTPDEETVIRDIKKKKLAGKTRLQGILDRHQNKE